MEVEVKEREFRICVMGSEFGRSHKSQGVQMAFRSWSMQGMRFSPGGSCKNAALLTP